MTKQRYYRLKSHKTKCPGCTGEVELLMTASERGPIFYICWDCERVFQAGVAEITSWTEQAEADAPLISGTENESHAD